MFPYPQAGRVLPFSIDKKEAKILSQRTLARALGRPAHLAEVRFNLILFFAVQTIFFIGKTRIRPFPPKEKKREENRRSER
jgi:hypothetical protein